MIRWWVGLTGFSGLAILLLLAAQGAASASCVTDRPPASPYAFVGTVIDTAKDNRVATVITDEGEQVKVLGTPASGWFATGVSSVDRRYALGGRYEFHPVNSSDPYQDNRCTATRKLAGPALHQASPSWRSRPIWLIGAVVLGGAVIAALSLRRFARSRT